MATLALASARVLADGRTLRTEFVTRAAALADTGVPDHLPGAAAGQALTLGGAACELVTLIAADHDRPRAKLSARANAASTVPPGRYTIRLCIADADGNEVVTHDVSGEWGSTTIGVQCNAGQELYLEWDDPIPADHTGRLYAAGAGLTLPAHRLLLTGIPAGATSYALSSFPAFADPDRQPDPITSWVAYWSTPEPVAYGATPTIAAPAGLIRDDLGNATGAFGAQPVVNDSIVDADGWCTEPFTRSASGKTLYVSTALGSDATGNPGTSPASPLKTIERAFALVPGDSGSAIRLRRGETYPIAVGLPSRGGIRGVPSQPLVVEDYWDGPGADPGTRPVILASASRIMDWNTGGGRPRYANVIFRRLRFRCDLAGSGFIAWIGSAEDFTFSDCVFDRVMLIMQSAAGQLSRRVTLHRCILIDAQNVEGGSHIQGAFGHGLSGLLFSQCCFDHNGWQSHPATPADYTIRAGYSHNVYTQYGAAEVVAWGTWFLRGGSHGIQIRHSGGVAESVFARNACDSYLGRGSAYYRKNVHLNAEDLTTKAYGRGAESEYSREVRGHHFVVEFSLFLRSLGGNAVACPVNGDNPDLGTNGLGRRFNVARHNTADGFGAFVQTAPTYPQHLSLRRNLIVARRHAGTPEGAAQVNTALDFRTTAAESFAWLDSDENAIFSTTVAPFRSQRAAGTVARTLLEHRAATGEDGATLLLGAAPTFTTPGYDLGSWSAANGGVGTEEALRDALRSRGPGEWLPVHDAGACAAAFRTAYKPTDVPSIDAAALGYYGAGDYRGESTPPPAPPRDRPRWLITIRAA